MKRSVVYIACCFLCQVKFGVTCKTGFLHFMEKTNVVILCKLTATLLRCCGWLPGHCCVVIRCSEWSLGACLLVQVKRAQLEGCFEPFDCLIAGELHKSDCFVKSLIYNNNIIALLTIIFA